MKKVISNVKISKAVTKNTCAISLEGELTLNSMEAIKKELTVALEKWDSLQLTVNNVTSIDLSWIQLLHSLKNTGNNLNKNIVIEMMLNPDAELLLARTGLSSVLENAKSNNQTIR